VADACRGFEEVEMTESGSCSAEDLVPAKSPSYPLSLLLLMEDVADIISPDGDRRGGVVGFSLAAFVSTLRS
jgi:hypothetical protein